MLKNPQQNSKTQETFSSFFKKNKFKLLIAIFLCTQFQIYTNPIHKIRPDVLARNRLKKASKNQNE